MTKVPADVFDSVVAPMQEALKNGNGIRVISVAQHLFHVIEGLERAEEEKSYSAKSAAYDLPPAASTDSQWQLRSLRSTLHANRKDLRGMVSKAGSQFETGCIIGKIESIEDMMAAIDKLLLGESW